MKFDPSSSVEAKRVHTHTPVQLIIKVLKSLIGNKANRIYIQIIKYKNTLIKSFI